MLRVSLKKLSKMQEKYKPRDDMWQILFELQILWELLEGLSYKLTPKVYDSQYRLEDLEAQMKDMQSKINRLTGDD